MNAGHTVSPSPSIVCGIGGNSDVRADSLDETVADHHSSAFENLSRFDDDRGIGDRVDARTLRQRGRGDESEQTEGKRERQHIAAGRCLRAVLVAGMRWLLPAALRWAIARPASVGMLQPSTMDC